MHYENISGSTSGKGIANTDEACDKGAGHSLRRETPSKLSDLQTVTVDPAVGLNTLPTGFKKCRLGVDN